MDTSLSKFWETVKDREAWYSAVHVLGKEHWLKLPTLARHHSNYLHELYFKTGGPSKEHRTSHHQWMNLKEVKRRRPVSSVQFSSIASDSLWPHGLQHARLPCPSPTPGEHPNSCPLSQWCHPAISSFVIPFSSCPQSFPASGSFQMSQLLASGGQSIGVSASTSVLAMNIQDWFPLGWTGWTFLQSKGLSIVFSNTIVQKHQFFGTQPSLWPSSHIHTWLLEKP